MKLAQKLVEIRKMLPYAQKDADGFKFKYVTEEQILKLIRSKMDELEVLLMPKVINTKSNRGKDIFTEIWFDMVWIDAANPKDSITVPWYAQGTDTTERGVGKAYSYGYRYFLLKFFAVPTGSDDPDRCLDKQESMKSTPKKKTKSDEVETMKKTLGNINNIAKWGDAILFYQKQDWFDDDCIAIFNEMKEKWINNFKEEK